MAVYRNQEYYIDRTAGEAIRRANHIFVVSKKRCRPWGDRLTYRIGEAMARNENLTKPYIKSYIDT